MFSEDESLNDPSLNFQDDNTEANEEINQDESSLSIKPKIQLRKCRFNDIFGILFFLILFLPPSGLSIYLSIWFISNYSQISNIKIMIFIIISFQCSIDNIIKSFLLYFYGVDNRPVWVIVIWIIFTLIDIIDSISSNIVRDDLINTEKKIFKNIILILLINIFKSIFVFLSDLGLLKGCKSS